MISRLTIGPPAYIAMHAHWITDFLQPFAGSIRAAAIRHWTIARTLRHREGFVPGAPRPQDGYPRDKETP